MSDENTSPAIATPVPPVAIKKPWKTKLGALFIALAGIAGTGVFYTVDHNAPGALNPVEGLGVVGSALAVFGVADKVQKVYHVLLKILEALE